MKQIELPILIDHSFSNIFLQKKERSRKARRAKEARRHKRLSDPNLCSLERFMSYRKLMLVANRRLAARKRGIPFTITKHDLVWPEYCPVLGFKLDYTTRGKVVFNMPTIDRVDPRFGYTPENSRIISFKANTIKSFATIDDLHRIISYVSKVKSEACSIDQLTLTD